MPNVILYHCPLKYLSRTQANKSSDDLASKSAIDEQSLWLSIPPNTYRGLSPLVTLSMSRA